ncbi:MAG: immunoglobulin-like domain-containing protein [Bacilli bacterium]
MSGANSVTLTVGDAFDPRAGVTALDKEEGDLTSKIEITGTVNTQKAGVYTLSYKVSDSKGLSTTKNRTVTVKEKEVTPPPAENTAPTISGASNVTINVGDTFDPRAGVTATDKEDGPLTSSITIEGKVDTSQAGVYTLTYRVADSKGLTASVTRTVTVKEKPVTPGDTYDPKKVYLSGDRVIYNGNEYVAKWWTQGDAPDKSAAWEKVVKPNPDGSVNYEPGRAYVGGNIVSYNGKTYKAKWWTTSVPGSDDSWMLVG